MSRSPSLCQSLPGDLSSGATLRSNSSRLPSYQFSNPDRERDSFLIAPATVLALPLAGSDWPSAGHVPSLEPIAVARQRPSAPSRVNSGAWKCHGGNGFWAGQSTEAASKGNRSRSLPRGHRDATIPPGVVQPRILALLFPQPYCLPSSLPHALPLTRPSSLAPVHLPSLVLSSQP